MHGYIEGGDIIKKDIVVKEESKESEAAGK